MIKSSPDKIIAANTDWRVHKPGEERAGDLRRLAKSRAGTANSVTQLQLALRKHNVK